MSSKTWSTPERREVGLFTDLSLFSEALELASEQGVITKYYLMEELSQRVRGLLFVESQSSRGVERLIRELRSFGWLQSVTGSSKSLDGAKFKLTYQGDEALKIFKRNKKDFLRHLTVQMHKTYIIPGWFVYRLWTINPDGQGEVAIPTPPRNWRPDSRQWEDKKWTDELTIQTRNSIQTIENIFPGAFPVEEEVWVEKVKTAWNRLSNLKRRTVAQPSSEVVGKEKEKMKTYTPRRRLAMAMREAAVKLLFSKIPPNSAEPDFGMRREPLLPRTYMAWCPRLESLELMFYTDAHPQIPGRLIFPTSVFRTSAPTSMFEQLNAIRNPEGESLWLHQPEWNSIKDSFLKVLVQEHQRAYTRVGSLYVPLLDVRDEVCRQLRLSAACFDDFIEKALRESLSPESKLSISVETDIREDQRSAPRLIRRPVWIGGTPHSLIAITEARDVERIVR